MEWSQIHRYPMVATMLGSYLQYVISTPRPLARQNRRGYCHCDEDAVFISPTERTSNLIETEVIDRRSCTWTKLTASGEAPEFPQFQK